MHERNFFIEGLNVKKVCFIQKLHAIEVLLLFPVYYG